MATIAAGASPATFLPASALNTSIRDVTFSASYPTGGEAISLTQLGLSTVYFAHATVKVPAGSVTSVFYNVGTGKLLAFTAAGEVANATNLIALVAEVVFFGRTY